ncbi:DUF1826 domain-containing protein [Roseivivax sediminis]|uniref:DUF1826 domain-containing protein n=1 Tax=Roseivivax sediminis TaxID=936889 RepID=A0A1I1V6I5_9RHOB|nr:DUF1826 domain-containing protein [Roseivivax sediminis]SFD78617.1 Protein of unknown function [Roseivivax sediminis]
MMLHSLFRPARIDGVVSTPQPDGLWLIRSPEVGGVIWQRRPLAAFQAWLDGLDAAQLPRARVVLRPDAVRAAATAACESAATPDGPERRRFIDDVAALADIFADVMDARWLRLRFDVVDGNACRRFHTDRVSARLVCTYRGTGTQYGLGGTGDPEAIRTVPTGAPFVMRGTLWPVRPDPGLVHRSPPIEGSGETRLLIVLDPVDEPCEET